MSIFLEQRIEGLDGALEALRALPAEIVSKSGGPVKTAVRKGGQVILKRVEANLRAVLAEDNADELVADSTGLLLSSLKLTRGKAPIGSGGERYVVRFSRKTYPDRKGKAVTTLKAAQILEYGSEKQRPRPYLRPAAASGAQEAISVMTAELLAGIKRAERKVAKGRR